MKRQLFFFGSLLAIVVLAAYPVGAQVIFSRPARSSPTPPDSAMAPGLPDQTGFSVLYFGSVGPRKKQATAVTGGLRIQPYSGLDSLLAQGADSLWGDIKQQNSTDRERLPALRDIPAIPPVRYRAWQAYRISSGFGWRRHPLGGDVRLHTGIDLPQPAGTPVYATADGVVKWVCQQPGGLGLGVCIRHSSGYETLYGHLAGYTVKPGESVRRGAHIGAVGSTGLATGPHLHYAVRYRGHPVDPARYCFLWVNVTRADWHGDNGPQYGADSITRHPISAARPKPKAATHSRLRR